MAHAVESKPCTVLQSQDMIVHGRDLRALPQTKKVPHQHKQVGSISAKIIVRRLDGRMAFVPEGQRDRSQGPANQQNGRVLKPCHSGFYASALEILWQGLGAKKLTITR